MKRFLVVDTISGCNTASAVYGHGKAIAFKRLPTDSLGSLCDIVSGKTSTINDVAQAENQLLVALYDGKPGIDTLDNLRFNTYMKLCSSGKTAVSPEQLPPTERADCFLFLRVHLQVIEWQSLFTGVANPCDWGWRLQNDQLVPVYKDTETCF